MKVMIFVVGVLVMCVPGCKKAGDSEVSGEDRGTPEDVRPRLTLPIQRNITGKDGRKLEVTIVRRTAEHIKIIRNRDQKSFDLPIANLSDLDQKFANKLPISVEVVKTATDKRQENRQKQLEIQEGKLRKLESKLSSGTLNGSQSSMVKGQIKRLKQDIIKLGGDVSIEVEPDLKRKKFNKRTYSS